jgi:hypothetical protein
MDKSLPPKWDGLNTAAPLTTLPARTLKGCTLANEQISPPLEGRQFASGADKRHHAVSRATQCQRIRRVIAFDNRHSRNLSTFGPSERKDLLDSSSAGRLARRAQVFSTGGCRAKPIAAKDARTSHAAKNSANAERHEPKCRMPGQISERSPLVRVSTRTL